MLDFQIAISVIGCCIGIAIFLAYFILIMIDIRYDSPLDMRYLVSMTIGILIFALSLAFTIRYIKIYDSPDVMHERLQNNVDKAERELQKFYIDYPEYKENKE